MNLRVGAAPVSAWSLLVADNGTENPYNTTIWVLV